MEKLHKRKRVLQRALIANSEGQRRKIKPLYSFPKEQTHGFESVFGSCEYASEGEEEAALIAYRAAIDSGCSSHLITRDSLPKGTKIDFSRAVNVKTAKSGEGLHTEGRANAGVLTECLVVENGTTSTNLISVSAFDREGCTSIFANGKGIITNKHGEVIAEANLSKQSNLYEFDIRTLTEKENNVPYESAFLASAKTTETIARWHKRLGHRSERNVKRAFAKGLITGGKIDIGKEKISDDLCDSCARAKSTKQSKKKGHNPDNSDVYQDIAMSNQRSIAAAQPLKKEIPLIATDLKGPMRVNGHKGEIHTQSFIECDTKFLRVYTLKAKSDALANLKDLLEVQLPSEGCHLGCYHADGAKELISAAISDLLVKSKTKMTYSPPYTAEMNSVVERSHRTLFEAAFAMLLTSRLGTVFWPYAVKYSALIFNHFPTQTAFGYMTPIQAKYGIIPDVSRFRTWGCVCYMHIPQQSRSREGFVEKAQRCYFMGIDTVTQSTIVWIIDLNEERISADVIFDEDQIIHQTAETATLEVAPGSKNKNDYVYLEGMVYTDDEDKMDYITTRIITQRGVLIAYRAPYQNGKTLSEEGKPIHVADVERMMEAHLLSNQILVADPKNKDPATKWKRKTSPEAPSPQVNEAKDSSRKRDTPSSTSKTAGKRKKAKGNAKPAQEQEEEGTKDRARSNTSDRTAGAISDRTADVMHKSQPDPGSRQRKQRQLHNVGREEESSLAVRLQSESFEYILCMEDFEAKHHNAFTGVEEWKEVQASLSRGNTSYDQHCLLVTAEEAQNSDLWQEADLKEINSLVVENNVWKTEPLPPNKKAITSKWVRKVKTNGTHKSRVCGRGFNMIEGIDFHETFAPVAKMTTFRIFLTLVAILKMFTGCLDIKTAYLNAAIEEDVWMKPPTGFAKLLRRLLKREKDPRMQKRIKRQLDGLKEGHYLKLLKAIYGTKQAGREWFKLMNGFLVEIGFVPNRADVCFYSIIVGKEYVLLLLYVDDIIIAASTEELKMKYVSLIGKKFKTSYSGKLEEYLNIALVHDFEGQTITMSQKRYIEVFYSQFNLPIDSKVKTPMQANLSLSSVEEEELSQRQRDYVKYFPFRQLLGCILYLNICTRPMISYTVSVLGKFAANPTFRACKALVWLAKFVYNTRDELLTLGGTTASQVNYCDSDWGGDKTTYKSRGGSVGFLGNGPVVWYSKMQNVTAQSTMEAEYMAMAPAMQNMNFVRNIVNQTGISRIKFKYASTLYVDNRAALAVANNPVRHASTKHVELKYQYTQDCVKAGQVVTEYVRSDENCSDPHTKALPVVLHLKHTPRNMGWTTIVKSDQRVLTIEDDVLECPRCSCGKAHYE